MISDGITPVQDGNLSVTYKQETSIVYIEVENIPQGKKIEGIFFKPSYKNDNDNLLYPSLLNTLTLGVDNESNLTRTYGIDLKQTDFMYYNFAEGEEDNKCMFVIYPPVMNTEHPAESMNIKIKYDGDDSAPSVSLNVDIKSEAGSKMLESFNNLEAGKVLYLKIPGSPASSAQ